ncbi:MAG: hypothetical protein Q7S70_02465 [bacterium]|nr:hypothetical protein [bacterium]
MIIGSKIKLSLLFLLLLTGSAIFLMRPVLRGISDASRQLMVERRNLFSLESKIRNLEKFQEEYENLKPDLAKADSLLVEDQLPVDFIRFLEAVSSEFGISLKISPLSSVKIATDPWPSSNFQLSLAGSYPKILQFIDKLENSRYLTNFQSLSFSRLTDAQLKSREFEKFSSGDVEGSVVVKVFVK